jgi:hypothetical protein
MKKFAIGMAVAASLVSSGAIAAEQRPTYMVFKAPAAMEAPVTVAPATQKVGKSNEFLRGVPLFVPLVGIAALLGLIAAFSTGHNGSPG